MFLICPIAGVGTRLQPFTYTKPKAFLKIAGMHLIDHILHKLEKTFPKGTDLIFVVGYKKRQITEFLTKNYSDYFKLHFVEQKPIGYLHETPVFSGLADAILLTKDYAKKDDIFIFLGDRLPMEDYSQIVITYHQFKCDGVMNVKRVKDPQFYGVIQLNNDGYIKTIIEKPKSFISDYAVSGAYLFGKSMTSRFFELLEEQSKTELKDGQEHQVAPVVQKLINEGIKLKVSEMRGEILDFGRPESLLEGNRLILSDLRLPDPTFENLFQTRNIVDSKIIPPVYIGKNVKIESSVIGPNVSIGDDVSIVKCILKESVIGDNATLKKIISSESIIGDSSILEELIKTNIIIGDSTCIAAMK